MIDDELIKIQLSTGGFVYTTKKFWEEEQRLYKEWYDREGRDIDVKFWNRFINNESTNRGV